MISERKQLAKRPVSNRKPSATLIAFEDVSLRIGGCRVLEGITWHVRQGQQWVVLGSNGAGKSTLLGAVARAIACNLGAERASGDVYLSRWLLLKLTEIIMNLKLKNNMLK